MIEVLTRLANVIKSKKLDAWLEKLEAKDEIRLAHPELVTVNDCVLAYNMGYIVEVENGRVTGFKRRRRERCKLISIGSGMQM